MMGIPRAEAQTLVAQSMLFDERVLMVAMQGAARMVLEGQHPAIIRNAVATPGGCTIGGLLTMEDGKIRSTMVWLTITNTHDRREQFRKLLMLRADLERLRDRCQCSKSIHMKDNTSFSITEPSDIQRNKYNCFLLDMR